MRAPFLPLVSMLGVACGEVVARPAADADSAAADAGPPDAAWTLTIALEQDTVTAPIEIGVEVDVTISRGGFDGDVEVALAGVVPGGLTAPPIVIPTGQTVGTFVVWIDDDAAVTTSPLTIEARAPGDAVTASAALAVQVDPTAPGFDLGWTDSIDEDTPVRRALWTVPSWSVPVKVFAATRNTGYAGTPIASWTALPGGFTGGGGALVPGSSLGTVVELIGDASASLGDVEVRLVASDGALRQHLYVDLTVAGAGFDPAIGTAGRTPFTAAGISILVAVDVDSAGRPLVIARSSGPLATVTRFTTAGAVDTTYGTAGTVALALVGDHRLVDAQVAGDSVYLLDTEISTGPSLDVRKLTGGALDASFSTDGLATVNAGVEPSAMRIRPNGKIVIAGRTSCSSCTMYGAIVRLNIDGTPDTGFGTAGVTTIPVADSNLVSMFFDASGSVIAAGAAGEDVLITRLSSAGVLDTTFGTGGTVTIDAVGLNFVGVDVTEAADGDLIVLGSNGNGGLSFVARLDASGALDAGFSGDGIAPLVLTTDGLEENKAVQLRYSAAGITVLGTRVESHASEEHAFAIRLDDSGAAVTSFGPRGARWLLGGTYDRENFGGARATATGYWIAVNDGTELALLRMLP